MATDLERLTIRLEVSQRKMERQLAAVSKIVDARTNNMQRKFTKANKNISNSFDKLGKSGVGAFRGIAKAASLAATALGVRELTRYADAWTQVENKIRSAEQISGLQARTTSELVDLANRGRAGLEETAELYSRLLRVSGNLGASELEVAKATEIVAKAFKAGGAAASEQASGVLQLSQALGSGFLQGDELRSLRENAPLIAQAIATEFETTIGGLKDLGAAGELTADRVFQAILKSQSQIEGAFNATTATMADGMTAFRNGMVELVGAFDDGSGASTEFAEGLADLGEFLSDSSDAAERFGARLGEVFKIFGEVLSRVSESFKPVSDGFSDMAQDAADAFEFIMDALQNVIAAGVGAGHAIKTAMLNAVDAVASGAIGIANAAIRAVDMILQKITDGINVMIGNVNAAIGAVNSLGVSVPTLPEVTREGLGLVDTPGSRGGDVGLAYREGYDRAFNYIQGNRNTVAGYGRRVSRAGDSPYDPNDPRGNQISPPSRQAGASTTSTASSTSTKPSGKSGGGSKSGETFAQVIEREKQALRDQIELIGLSEKATAKMEAQQRLLAEAKKRGLDLDKQQAATGLTLREEIDAQAESIANLSMKYQEAEERAKFFDDMNEQVQAGLVDAIIEGESLTGVLEDVAKAFAKAALQAALFGDGPMGGTGGGIFGNVLNSAFGSLAGARAMGGPVSQGKPYLVGERGPEIMVPSTSGKIVPNNKLGGGGTNVTYSPVIDARGADAAAVARLEIAMQRSEAEFSTKVVSVVRSANSRTTGGRL